MSEIGGRSKPQQAPQPRTQRERQVICKRCGAALTDRRQATEIGGRHEYTLRNPAGYSFHVVCYREAPGCRRLGEPTVRDTWFPGYAWSLVECNVCEQHLGWHFRGPDAFHGLIATRLVLPDAAPQD